MPSSIMLVPPEILEAILFFNGDHPASLMASSLVCATWRDVSQRLLFAHHPLRLRLLLELGEAERHELQPLITRFRHLFICDLAFVRNVRTAGNVEDREVDGRAIMFSDFLARLLHAISDPLPNLGVTSGALPWLPLSFQLISVVELQGPVQFETYMMLRDFLAGFANLEHIVLGSGSVKVLKSSSLPSWTGLRLRTLQCPMQIKDSGLDTGVVRAILSWLAASDSPRLTTLCVNLRETPSSPAFHIRDPLKAILVTSKRTLQTLEVHISSYNNDFQNLRLSTWLIPDCSIMTLHLFVNFSHLHAVIDSATLPYLHHLKVTSPAYGDVHSAPSGDLITRMTLPSLDRVSVTFSHVNPLIDDMLLRPFASAERREILEVTMEYEEDMSFGLFD